MYCTATHFAVGLGWGGAAQQLSLSQLVLCVRGVVLFQLGNAWHVLEAVGHVGRGRWCQALAPAHLRIVGDGVTVQRAYLLWVTVGTFLSWGSVKIETAHLCRGTMRVPPAFSFNP